MELMMEVVSNVGEDEFYRTERYNVPLVVILINSKDNNIFDILEKNLRATDIIQQLSSQLFVVFLSHTDYNNGYLFIDKIKRKLDFTYTLCEFKESKFEFIEKLFLDNNKLI